MEKYVDYEMCKKCGGACCKQNGCVYAPTDFKSMDFSYLKEEIEKGKISISGQASSFAGGMWTYIPYLRAKNNDAEIVDLITKGGPCANLTEKGCSLTEEERPTFGLLVKPTKIGGPWKLENQEQALNWIDYSDVLEKLVKYYTNKEVIDVVVEEISKQIIEIKEKLKNNIELNPMEKINASWYYNVMANKPYYTPDEVKKLVIF